MILTEVSCPEHHSVATALPRVGIDAPAFSSMRCEEETRYDRRQLEKVRIPHLIFETRVICLLPFSIRYVFMRV